MAFRSRFATVVPTTLALLMLVGCTTQTSAPAPEPGPPTLDIWTAASQGNIPELAANKHAGTDLGSVSSEFRQVRQPWAKATPLTSAAVVGQVEAAQWLLDNGADVNARNGDGSTSLQAAVFLGHADVAKVLIDGGVDTSIRNYEGQSAADIAQVDWDTTYRVAAMLQLNVDRETVESGRAKIVAMMGGRSSGGGFEELAFAIVNDDAAAAKAALAGGADVNARDPNLGSTPLIVAAFMGRAEIAKMLLVAGADMNATNNDGADALTVADLDWQTTQDIAMALQIPLTNPEAIQKGKAQIAEMLRAKK